MKKYLNLLLTIIMAFLLVSCGFSEKVNKEKEAKINIDNGRLIAGSNAVAEILGEMDIPIVGRSSTQYEVSEKIKKVKEVGLPMNPDLETIKSLRPDMYITSGALEEMIGDRLRENGVNTMFCKLDSYDSVKETIGEISEKFNRKEKGESILNSVNKEEKEILSKISSGKKPRVMILFGAPGHFMLATKNSFAGSLVEKLGGENIANKANYTGLYVPFSMETALSENPDIIFRMYHGHIDEAKKQVNNEFSKNPQWKNFNAVLENKVYDLDPSVFGVTGNIKITDSLKKMQEYMYR